MRKPVQIALIAAVVVLVAATAVLFQQYRQAAQNYETTKAAEDAAHNQYVEVLGAIGEIQDSLSAIAVGDSAAQVLAQRSREMPSAPDRRQALERIAMLRASIQRARGRIDALEASLSRSRVRVAGMQKLIANLRQTVAEREQRLTALTGQVDSLQTRVTGLVEEVAQNQDTIQARDRVLEDRRRELGTIYYVVGSKKELRDRGIIQPRGGVLGVGKTLTLSGRVDESAFTPLDTDLSTVVSTPVSKRVKVEVLSPQPVSSYELREVDGRVELHILDPQEFRKVKHLVIMTKA